VPTASVAEAASTGATSAAPKSVKDAATPPKEVTTKGQPAPTARGASPPVPANVAKKVARMAEKTPAKSVRKAAATATRPKTAKAVKPKAASAGPKRNVAKPKTVVKSKGPKKAGGARGKR